ncbi:hypothetical protein IBX73_04515 [candidate division WOR-3 bacterium]|nr:hypothetical protein [candidate division WOR-3 bacterium]
MKGREYIIVIITCLLMLHCASNIFAARYYRLLEPERVKYLGLMGIDTLAARQYLNQESPSERTMLYEEYWQDRSEERVVFERRSGYAYREFGKSAPLSDDRIRVYVRHGEPRREAITPEHSVGVSPGLEVNPAEVWTYNAEGLKFDFVRIARAYKLLSVSEFGDRVRMAHLRETAADTIIEVVAGEPLDFMISYGRFRQQKNLTRLELYLEIAIDDTVHAEFFREIKAYDRHDSMVHDTKHVLVPAHAASGRFVDESNLWLSPEEYRVEVALTDLRTRRTGKKIFTVNLVEYAEDVKEISDLIPARLIDRSFTHEKFEKPVGRVIPLLQTVLPVRQPFYLYAEAYNLETKDGMHQVRTIYEVYNKDRMRQEVVDVMVKDWIEPGNTAFLGAEYHPMDLVPGSYMIVLKVKDILSGKERSAVAEFIMVERANGG